MLWYYFPSTLAEKDVYLDRIINQIPAPYNLTQPFIELVSLYDTHVKSMLRVRKDIVHYFQLETQHYWGNIQNFNLTSQLELFNEKYRYADTFAEQLKHFAAAFEFAVRLIGELPLRVYSDTV